MNDDGVCAHLLHQNNIACETRHGFIAAHRVTTQFNNDRCTRIALHVWQGPAERLGGFNPIAVHVLRLHPVSVRSTIRGLR